MKKNGKAEATIRYYGKALFKLSQNCNLSNPENVKQYIANLSKKEGYKKNLCCAYDLFAKANGLTWQKPQYFVPSKLPKIPQEAKIDMIISNASLKLATAISISKDTGLRPIEVMNLTLRDLDLQNSTIYPTTAKHGSPRALKLKTATVNILNKYLMSRNMGLNDKLFGKWNSDTYGKWFRHTRNKVSNKMADITIKSIRLYDLRHFYATMTYHRTKDILYLKQQMGHKRIATTLLYTQLLNLNEDEWTCKGATTVEQATQLIENGFQYVTEMDGVKLFRKRK